MTLKELEIIRNQKAELKYISFWIRHLLDIKDDLIFRKYLAFLDTTEVCLLYYLDKGQIKCVRHVDIARPPQKFDVSHKIRTQL